MPERVFSALNTGGTSRVTAQDQLGAQAQDNAVRQALLAEQARQFNLNYGDRANERAFQQNIQGTYADRAKGALDLQGLANTGQRDIVREQGATQLGLADKANQVPMARLGLEQRAFDEGAALRGARSQAEMADLGRGAKIDDLIYDRALSRFQQPADGGAPNDDLRSLAILASLRNKQALPDFAGQDEARADRATARTRENASYIDGEVQKFLAAGRTKEAAALAAANNRPMPQITLDSLADNPAVSTPVQDLLRSANEIGQSTLFGSGSDGRELLQGKIEAAIKALVENGIDEPRARAFIIGKIKQAKGTARGGFTIPYLFRTGADVIGDALGG